MTTQADGGGKTDFSCSSDVERNESIKALRNDVEMAFTGQQPPMASPLSGGYLLIILAEPHNEQHKDLILKRLAKGQFIKRNKNSTTIHQTELLCSLELVRVAFRTRSENRYQSVKIGRNHLENTQS